jgi:hypothetical protein
VLHQLTWTALKALSTPKSRSSSPKRVRGQRRPYVKPMAGDLYSWALRQAEGTRIRKATKADGVVGDVVTTAPVEQRKGDVVPMRGR